MTVRAANAQEAVFQATAFQIGFELALHMQRQGPLTRRQMRYERRVVRFNQLIQERLLGPVTRLFARTRGGPQRWRPCRPTTASCIASVRYLTSR